MIYEIRNLKTGKKYVGSSKYPKTRLQTHKRQLDAKNHYNSDLQSDWEDFNFEFEIVSGGLKSKEQEIFDHYIQKNNWDKLYNKLKTVNGFGDLNHKDIPKNKIESLIKEKKTSSQIASELNITQGTLTSKVRKYFECGLQEARKQVYKKNAVFGRCEECDEPLKRTQKQFCSNECKFSNGEYNESRIPSVKPSKNKKAKCTECGWTTFDDVNASGAWTVHRNKEHGGDQSVGFEVFEIEIWECPECKWVTEDTENSSGSITKHFEKNHSQVFEKRKDEEKGSVRCKICDSWFERITNTHLQSAHDISPTEYKKRYGPLTLSDDHVFWNAEEIKKMSPEERQEAKDRLLSIVKKHPFPVPSPKKSLDQIVEEIGDYNLKGKTRTKDGAFRSNIWSVGNRWLKSHFRSYWESSFYGKQSPVQGWKSRKSMDRVARYRLGISGNEFFDISLRELVRGLSVTRYSISFMKPLFAASVWDYFLNESDSVVFDPCAGFGSRLLGIKAIRPDVKYIGVEQNPETAKELQGLAEKCPGESKIICDRQENIKNIDFDFAFTSPPYPKTEVYSNGKSGCENWDFFWHKLTRFSPMAIRVNKDMTQKDIDYPVIKNNSHFKNASEEGLVLC